VNFTLLIIAYTPTAVIESTVLMLNRNNFSEWKENFLLFRVYET
jgi:hypothetical protein